MTAQCDPPLPSPPGGGVLLYSLNGHTGQANASGSFLISNVAVPDAFPVDNVGDDYLFLTAVRVAGGQTTYAFGRIPFQITPGDRFVFETGNQDFSTFMTTPPVLPESIALATYVGHFLSDIADFTSVSQLYDAVKKLLTQLYVMIDSPLLRHGGLADADVADHVADAVSFMADRGRTFTDEAAEGIAAYVRHGDEGAAALEDLINKFPPAVADDSVESVGEAISKTYRDELVDATDGFGLKRVDEAVAAARANRVAGPGRRPGCIWIGAGGRITAAIAVGPGRRPGCMCRRPRLVGVPGDRSAVDAQGPSDPPTGPTSFE